MDSPRVRELVRELLVELGEDPAREGLAATPDRVATALAFLTEGYGLEPAAVVRDALFEHPSDHMVIVQDIELYSLCEHHLMPFFGRAHIGYIPNGQIVGVSKLARLVDLYARRLQLQERLTEQVAQSLMNLGFSGVGVVIEAQHLCMMMRGVQKQNSQMVTSAMLGSFRRNAQTRAEFLNLIGRPHS
jgi:GTP cyclohydrolase IA